MSTYLEIALRVATPTATHQEQQQVRPAWPRAARDAALRFAQPHAKLFPFIGRKVRTPEGAGTLVQVFALRVTVLLDSDIHHCSFFLPAEVAPVSWDL